jgi:hypothetical protein
MRRIKIHAANFPLAKYQGHAYAVFGGDFAVVIPKPAGLHPVACCLQVQRDQKKGEYEKSHI